jgi:hypothetical protein
LPHYRKLGTILCVFGFQFRLLFGSEVSSSHLVFIIASNHETKMSSTPGGVSAPEPDHLSARQVQQVVDLIRAYKYVVRDTKMPQDLFEEYHDQLYPPGSLELEPHARSVNPQLYGTAEALQTALQMQIHRPARPPNADISRMVTQTRMTARVSQLRSTCAICLAWEFQ